MVYGGFLLTTLKLAAKLYIHTQLKKKKTMIFSNANLAHTLHSLIRFLTFEIDNTSKLMS